MDVASPPDIPVARGGVSVRAAPDRSIRAWLSVLSIALGTFVLVTSEFLPVGLLPAIARSLNVAEGTAGLLVTLPGAAAALAAPLLLIGAGRLNRRAALILLSLLLAISNLVAALAPDFLVMLLARVILGAAVGGFWTIAVPTAARLVPAGAIGLATSLVIGGISIGTILGVPAGTLIGELAGWRTAFLATSGLGAVALVLQVLALPSLPSAGAIRPRDLVHGVASRNARVGIAATVFLIGGQFAAYTYVTPFLLQVTGIAPGLVPPILLAFGIAGLLGNFVAGWLAGRHLKPAFVGIALLLASTLLLLVTLGTVQPAAIVLVTLWGVAFGGLPVVLQTWIYRSATGSPEGGQAFFVAVLQVFLALGALAGGLSVNMFGVASAILLGGCLCMLGVATIWGLGRDPGRPAA